MSFQYNQYAIPSICNHLTRRTLKRLCTAFLGILQILLSGSFRRFLFTPVNVPLIEDDKALVERVLLAIFSPDGAWFYGVQYGKKGRNTLAILVSNLYSDTKAARENGHLQESIL